MEGHWREVLLSPTRFPMPQLFFQASNTLALVAWIGLLLFPGRRLVSSVLCAMVVPGLLATAYVALIGWKLSSGGPPP